MVEDILSVFSLLFYWFLSFNLVKTYRVKYFKDTSASDMESLHWLKIFLVIFGVFAVLPISIALNQTLLWQVFHLGLIGVVYYGGIKGYFFKPSKKLVSNEKPISESNEKSTWSEELRTLAKSKFLDSLATKKMYRDPELTLQKLSKHTDLPQNLISFIINTEFNSNFRTLVNVYRIEEIKQRIKTKEMETITITGLAFECGFNSEASFYRVFKAQEGISPKEFMKN